MTTLTSRPDTVSQSPRTTSPERREAERRAMVARQLARRGIRDRRVLDAMLEVPREAFISEEMWEFAYEDSPLPIAAEQTISQPYIVAEMIELAGIQPGDRVLEVGAGSGYAAAVMSRIAGRVYAIERHGELARSARRVLDELHYDNVEIVHGDGTRGLPDAAPFDAIVVSAGGRLPQVLKLQLKIGGTLVIPVDAGAHQVLTRLVRTSEDRFETSEHGLVRFVPLTEGEVADIAAGGEPARTRSQTPGDALSALSRHAEPFYTMDELAALTDRFSDRRVVLLGESTHGTSEFYDARAAITRRLVREHGFTVVAVEADWPDAAYYDRAIREGAEGQVSSQPFLRFPRWMWRNEETWRFLKGLRDINEGRPPERQAGFYGLDVYSLCASIEAVLGYLDEADADAAETARERYACLTPYCRDPAAYGRMRIGDGYERCEDNVVAVLSDLMQRRVADGEALFDAEQNARIVMEAEAYYRVMYYGGAASWNLRDQHMFDTLERVLEQRGPGAKAIVWAHNSHIGDAAQTEMGWARGEHNIGQLARQRFGEDCALIGFSTDSGEVAAADRWDGPMRVKRVRTGLEGTSEALARDSRLPRFLLDMNRLDEAGRTALSRTALQRAIGVIYRPETEYESHYFQARLAEQFDAWVWFETTHAVAAASATPLPGAPDEFPFGV